MRSDPRTAASWRFRRADAGSGALGDLMAHSRRHDAIPGRADRALQRPDGDADPAPPGARRARARTSRCGEADELVDVENEDWASALVEFGSGDGRVAGGEPRDRRARTSGCASRSTAREGALGWDFERMNELERFRRGRRRGLHARLGRPVASRLRPLPAGRGMPMGYDDLRVLEAANLLAAVRDGEQRAPGLEEMVATARVLAAVERSAATGAWERPCEGRQRAAQLRRVRDDGRHDFPVPDPARVLEAMAGGLRGNGARPPGISGRRDLGGLELVGGFVQIAFSDRTPGSTGCTRRSTCSARRRAPGRSCATRAGRSGSRTRAAAPRTPRCG